MGGGEAYLLPRYFRLLGCLCSVSPEFPPRALCVFGLELSLGYIYNVSSPARRGQSCIVVWVLSNRPRPRALMIYQLIVQIPV